jgi:hypothetical protein
MLVTAIDGQINGGPGIDKFRINIWDKDTEDIVYDNQMGASDAEDPATAIGGGSIVIHGYTRSSVFAPIDLVVLVAGKTTAVLLQALCLFLIVILNLLVL